jgi:apolipoprotein D and lipocalin family protein
MKNVLNTLVVTALFSAVAQATPVTAVSEINLGEYAGTWYEIASIPPIFQAGCRCTTANYSILDNGNVQVKNSCTVASFPISTTGEARVPNPAEPAKLKVRFFGVADADYWVLKVAPDYSYALVGTPDRKFVWILSRERTLDNGTFQELSATAAEQGFSLEKIRITKQEGCEQ